jgi:hypothetical protein
MEQKTTINCSLSLQLVKDLLGLLVLLILLSYIISTQSQLDFKVTILISTLIVGEHKSTCLDLLTFSIQETLGT